MRINSPVFTINRICTKAYEMPAQYPGEDKCVTITAGTPVILPVSSIHM